MSINFIGKFDKYQNLIRLFRIIWHNKNHNKQNNWRSKKITFALKPKLINLHKELDGFILYLFGLRIHYKVSYGGYYV